MSGNLRDIEYDDEMPPPVVTYAYMVTVRFVKARSIDHPQEDPVTYMTEVGEVEVSAGSDMGDLYYRIFNRTCEHLGIDIRKEDPAIVMLHLGPANVPYPVSTGTQLC